MHRRCISNFVLRRPKTVAAKCMRYGRLNVAFYHHAMEHDDEPLPSEWYRKAYAKLLKLTHVLKSVEQIDGRLRYINNGSIITNDCLVSQMQTFNSLAKAFIRSPSMQHALNKSIIPASQSTPVMCFSKSGERSSLTLDSLTSVCNFLKISAQQRKSIRLTVCREVTQHHIWQGALEEILRTLKAEMNTFQCRSQAFQMAEQIASRCIKFLADAKTISNSDPPSWMRASPLNKVDKPVPMRKWEEVLEMFVDLSQCLGKEQRLAYHISKLEMMREGLSQIKDILVERDISYKEVQRQDSLVQKKLSKNLGHSSKCLFTLLLYYLYGSVTDIEVDVCGGVYKIGGRFFVCIGKILTSGSDEMILNGVKQLSRALGVYKFVWETAAMKGMLELQGHVWCVGAKERNLTYRGNVFFVHEIKL